MSGDIGPSAFFKAASRAFSDTIDSCRTRPELVALL